MSNLRTATSLLWQLWLCRTPSGSLLSLVSTISSHESVSPSSGGALLLPRIRDQELYLLFRGGADVVWVGERIWGGDEEHGDSGVDAGGDDIAASLGNSDIRHAVGYWLWK
ncbi:hypothetical protein Tco_0169255 [Tanacetum coccineum]